MKGQEEKENSKTGKDKHESKKNKEKLKIKQRQISDVFLSEYEATFSSVSLFFHFRVRLCFYLESPSDFLHLSVHSLDLFLLFCLPPPPLASFVSANINNKKPAAQDTDEYTGGIKTGFPKQHIQYCLHFIINNYLTSIFGFECDGTE